SKITAIRFRNYKRLQNFTLRAQDGNILVGPNNSGKSSILDAFRLLEAGIRYSRRKRPSLLNTPEGVFDGYEIPEAACPFHLVNVITNYDDNEAVIEFDHENGATAHLRLTNDRTVRFFIDARGRRFGTSKQFREAFPVDLIVVPTLSPLESYEPLIQQETVRRNRTTRLAARSFRNIWYLEDDAQFKVFKERVERAWDGVSLQPPELVRDTPARVEMYFEENRVTREIQWAGFGFQVWLQIHTHLIRGNQGSILVLDEPDIYLHPDLQHRLYKDVKELFGQYFLATHAVEIINVAETSEILMVEPDRRMAKRIKRDADYDAMLNYIGSAENADFAKIARIQKVLFVEGQDAKILRRFARRLGLENLASEQKSPVFQLGGFSQWRRAESTIWAFKNLLDIEVATMCLFDRDYRSSEEVQNFIAYMGSSDLECRVFGRKEIENYLIIPKAISKSVSARLERAGKDAAAVTPEAISSIVDSIASELKNSVSAHITSNVLRFAREQKSKEDDATIISRALATFEDKWGKFEGRCTLIPGKETLKKIFQRIQENYGVSITIAMIQDQIRPEDLDDELREVLNQLDGFFAG
ncbi:ATP-dependent nuclease, partial [Rhodovulum sulfidophilum]|uniref:ATP-dependent nuclease n=1 Tax=Rhodovulum sulfidophilum TaxID=35806 RepID=UPI001F2AD755